MDNSVIVSLRDIVVEFDGQRILDGLNLDIHDKEFVTLLGPSGCGKTTTLRLIAGFLEPNAGQVLLKGQDITGVPPYKRPVNTVFQKYALFPHLNVFENVAFGLRLKKMDEETIRRKVRDMLEVVGLKGFERRSIGQMSGGQQQRVAIARSLVNEPEILLLDEPLGALDLKLRKEMQLELKRLQREMNITFIYVTHDQEEALTLSDRIVVMSEGKIQQIGTPTDIYNEPVNSFVADFIGESNILNGTMIRDGLVNFCGHDFECVDKGFGENKPVDVVVRPEDLYIFPVSDAAQLRGVVQSCIFKGVHYEMTVLCGNYELVVQDYHCFPVGDEVGLLVKPFDIHIMKKERTENTFEATIVDETHVEFLGYRFECLPLKNCPAEGTKAQVAVGFDRVVLLDNEEDGMLTGEVKFILYKGDHYHLTVLSDWEEDVFVDTNDVWDDGDRVGISIPADAIRVIL